MVSIERFDSMEETLKQFAIARASDMHSSIPTELEAVLEEISRAGVPYYSWTNLREFLEAKLVAVIDGFNTTFGYEEQMSQRSFQARKDDLIAALRSFDGAPFTIQRFAEMLLAPERQYQATHKLLNSLEKILSVSSTLPSRDRTSSGHLSSNIQSTPSENVLEHEPQFLMEPMEFSPITDGQLQPALISHDEVHDGISVLEERLPHAENLSESVIDDMHVDGN